MEKYRHIKLNRNTHILIYTDRGEPEASNPVIRARTQVIIINLYIG